MDIKHKGENIFINGELLIANKVTRNLFAILETRYELQVLLRKENDSKKCDPTIISKITELEFRLQKLWGYTQDIASHFYSYSLNRCTCPKMDNREMFGAINKLVDINCPYHSDYQSQSQSDSV